MKTILLTILMIPTVLFAQEIGGYDVREFKGRYFAMPQVQEFQLVASKNHTNDFCEFGRFSLAEMVTIYEKYKCGSNPENLWCKNVVESVSNFATMDGGMSWGPSKNIFTIEYKNENHADAAPFLARELGVDVSRIEILKPDLSVLGSAVWVKNSQDHENFYQKIIRTFGIQSLIKMDKKGTRIMVENRLDYCSLKEGAITFKGNVALNTDVKVPAPEHETKALYSLYDGVMKDWDKLEKKKWNSSLHKMLYAGVIIKNRLGGEEKEVSKLEEIFEKFFFANIEDETLSVNPQRFRDMAEFTARANPPHFKRLTTELRLKQIEE